jgi:hypothetical protein
MIQNDLLKSLTKPKPRLRLSGTFKDYEKVFMEHFLFLRHISESL